MKFLVHVDVRDKFEGWRGVDGQDIDGERCVGAGAIIDDGKSHFFAVPILLERKS